MWRCRNSAAANRRALQSDYTSATEKTPTPLNGWCTKPQKPSCFAPTPPRNDVTHDTDTQLRERDRADSSNRQKALWHLCFHTYREFNSVLARAMKIKFDGRRQRRERCHCVGFTQVEIFFHRCTRGGVARRWIRSKPSESGAK